MERENYIDNLKGLLIILVVFAHAIEPFLGGLFKYIYIAIYLFHMPMFIFISGYLSTRVTPKKLIKNYVIPYFIFQTLYCLFDMYILKVPNRSISYTTPYWILWYLMALIAWIMITPLFSNQVFKNPRIAIIYASIIGLVIGYENTVGYYLSLSRIIVFYPFFLAGYYTKVTNFRLESIKQVFKGKIFIGLGTVAILVFLLFKYESITVATLYGSYPYKQLDYTLINRMTMYVIASILSLGVLLIMPGGKCGLSKIGKNSLYVFLLHGFIIRIIPVYFNLSMLSSNSHKMIYALIITGLIVSILSLEVVKKIVSYITVYEW